MDDQGTLDAGSAKVDGGCPSLYRRLRNVASLLCLTVCIVFVAFWVQSYDLYGAMQSRLTPTKAVAMRWFQGGMTFYGINDSGRVDVSSLDRSFHFEPAEEYLAKLRAAKAMPNFPAYYQFSIHSSPGLFSVTAPHWFLVVVTGMLAVLSKPKPRFKFSLRDILIVVTLVAVVLGALEAASKYLPREIPF